MNKQVHSDKIKFEFGDLGKFKGKSTLDIEDITVIFGLPDSGKSYVLKIIYSYLFFIDRNNRKEVDIPEYMSPRSILTPRGENSSKLRYLYDTIANLLTKMQNKMTPQTDREISIKTKSEIIDLEFNFNEETFSKSIIQTVQKNFFNFTGSANIDNLKMNETTLVKLISDAISTMPLIFSFEDPLQLDISYQTLMTMFPSFRTFYEKMLASKNSAKSVMFLHLSITIQKVIFSNSKDVSVQSKIDFVWEKNSADSDTDEIIEPPFRSISGHRDEVLYLSEYINTVISRKAIEKLSTAIMDSIEQTTMTKMGINSMKFIPYGRNLVTQMLNSSLKKNRFSRDIQFLSLTEIPSMPLASYYKWLDVGRENLIKADEEFLKIFSPLLRGKLGVNSHSSSIYYEDEQGMKFDLSLSSAMVGEVAGIMLPLLKMDKGSLLIIEEPEAQLHLSTQLIMGFILGKIVQKTGIKLLLSTHSDILALMLIYSTQKSLTREKVSNFFEEVCKQKVDSDVIDLLASIKGKIKINFYSIENGVMKPKSEKEVRASVPGITDYYERFLDWVLTLNGVED